MIASPAVTPRERLRQRLDAAMGRVPCDLIIRNARFLDVFSCRFREGELAIADGTIVGIEPGRSAHHTLDAGGRALVPGFIDAHVHIESSMLLPHAFAQAVLPRGTTAAVCDPHELANVVGTRGIRFFLEAAEHVPLDLFVMLSSCVPATALETNGGGSIGALDLAPLAAHPRAIGLAEVMNFPGVLHGDPAMLDKLALFCGRPIDGHAPLFGDTHLSAYATAGISSCHESSERKEAEEKLVRGLSVWIREGSVAKDLEALAPLLTLATSQTMGFCTDDRNPHDIAVEGHLDHLIRKAIDLGVMPEVAYRAASFSVARHYGLDRGAERIGAIAPGYKADLVLLDDIGRCAVHSVHKAGELVGEGAAYDHAGEAQAARDLLHTVRASVPEAEALLGPRGRVHVIGVVGGKLLTEARVMTSDDPDVRRLSVLERHGHGRPPANAYVTGFGPLRGAIASSVGHDSHNLIVVGDETRDMRAALAALIEMGGGFAVVRDGAVVARLALPYGGLMSDATPTALAHGLATLKAAGRAAGCTLDDPFLQLAFLSLPVIPTLKLTDHGLVDVDRFAIIDVRAP